MVPRPSTAGFKSFVGVDLHTCTVTLCAVDPTGKKIDKLQISTNCVEKIDHWLKQLPRPCWVAVETCPFVEWVIDHSPERKAPKENTQKKYVQAQALLKQVIEAHPKTPWADLAQDELSRGLGCKANEWHHNPQYEERAKLIPTY